MYYMFFWGSCNLTLCFLQNQQFATIMLLRPQGQLRWFKVFSISGLWWWRFFSKLIEKDVSTGKENKPSQK